ncbi:MAG: carbohydrate kinase family protein [Bacilli bacterium]|nr:carbohydrate kinase family protein [Bacilli bacterium]
MEIITVGKPAVNIYINLVEFPQDGDVFRINKKIESLGNASATSAVLLAKWGLHVNFCGSIGNDAYQEQIQNAFKEVKINTKYLETDYEGGSAVNHLIINNATKNITKILYSSDTSAIKRFKFDFTPDWAVFDGTDVQATLGVINTNPDLKSVFYLNTINKEINNIAKKCTWIVTNQNYAINLTKATLDGTAESYVSMYQQLVDINGQSNYIILLNNHKILYVEDGKVKMLPDLQFVNEDNSSFDSVFTGAFTFAQAMGLTLDESIKFANTAASISLGVVGEVPSIPELQVVMDNCGLAERIVELKNKMAEDVYQKTQTQVPAKPKLGQAFSDTQSQQNVAPAVAAPVTPQQETPQANIPTPNVEAATQVVASNNSQNV